MEPRKDLCETKRQLASKFVDVLLVDMLNTPPGMEQQTFRQEYLNGLTELAAASAQQIIVAGEQSMLEVRCADALCVCRHEP